MEPHQLLDAWPELALGALVVTHLVFLLVELFVGKAPISEGRPPPIPNPSPHPSFAEVDAIMNDWNSQYTEDQKQKFWEKVKGKIVRWEGRLVLVEEKRGCLLLKINPETIFADVEVYLADKSAFKAFKLKEEDQIVTVEGVLKEHSIFGYTITDARIIKVQDIGGQKPKRNAGSNKPGLRGYNSKG